MRKKIILHALLAFGVYILLYLAADRLEHISPSGPCVPGGGVLFLLLALPLSAGVLFLLSLRGLKKGRKQHYLPATVHGLVLLVCMMFLIGIFR